MSDHLKTQVYKSRINDFRILHMFFILTFRLSFVPDPTLNDAV